VLVTESPNTPPQRKTRIVGKPYLGITSCLPVTARKSHAVLQVVIKISQISKTKAAGANFDKLAEL
jgi:hypothetical protein